MSRTRHTYLQVLFYSAGVANIYVAACYFFAFEDFCQRLGIESVPQTPLLPMYAQLFAVAVLLFGIAYLIAGRWPTSPASFSFIALGAVGKLAVFSIMLTYALTSEVTWQHVELTFFDFLYAILFSEYLLWFRREVRSSPTDGS